MPEVKALVNGGKASAAPPLGPALGPLGVNIGEVINKINEKTKVFDGMQVPITVVVDDDKNVSVDVGTPPVSALVKKEAKVDKLSGRPNEEKVANLKIEQCIKVAKMKIDGMGTSDLKNAVKQVIGSCVTYGILIEGSEPKDAIKDVDAGKYDEPIKNEKTELTDEELKQLEAEKKDLAKSAEAARAAREKEDAEKASAATADLTAEEEKKEGEKTEEKKEEKK